MVTCNLWESCQHVQTLVNDLVSSSETGNRDQPSVKKTPLKSGGFNRKAHILFWRWTLSIPDLDFSNFTTCLWLFGNLQTTCHLLYKLQATTAIQGVTSPLCFWGWHYGCQHLPNKTECGIFARATSVTDCPSVSTNQNTQSRWRSVCSELANLESTTCIPRRKK